MLPHDDKASSSLHDRPLNPSNSEDGRLSRGHGGKHSRSRRKVHSIVSSSNAAALEIQQQPATLSSSRMPESEGEGGREPDASTLETDLNQDRRKRQRTASPTGASFPSTPFTWGEQLKAAALEESAGAETEKEKVTDIASLEEEKVTKESGLRSYVELPKKEQNHSSSVKDKNVDPTDPPPPRLIKQQEMAMPEKVLKIRPDGRLGSPKKKGVVGNRKSGDKRKSRNPDFEPTRKIVTIKYGSDKESRALLARRIQEIISKEPNTSAEIRTPAPKAAGPSKPTHPFFLGALARNTDADQSTLDKDQKDMATQSSVMPGQEKETSPRKGTSAAKAAASKDAWERVGGFGGKSGDASNLRVTKFPGASEPLWPPKDMFHIRDLPAPIASIAEKIETLQLHQSPRKLKHAAIQIAEPEEVMLPYTALVRVYQKDADGLQDTTLSDVKTFHHPLRKVLTGRELQWAISRNLACRPAVQSAESKVQEGAEIHSSQIKYPSVHKAVLRAFEKVASSQSAFDRFECETQDWMHKYAPNCAEEILQQGHEATLLRSWLKSHTITTVESGKADIQKFKESSVVSGRHVRGSKRKKRKRVGELNDFIISTDEEADEMSELTYPEDIEQDKHALSPTKKSLVRNSDNPGVSKSGQQQKNANAVVISGPHGCGKTAAVYAVAQELGFEVFEINAGSRRNGKDLLDKVGDMSRNHLVNHTHSTEEGDLSESNESSLQLTESLEQELLSGRQGTMNSFFKPKDTMKKLAKGKPGRKRLASKVDEKPKPAKSQKQSLILLEEVDVLFEEDKQFWTVAFSLILQSKRPIIMTCADESLIPLDELILHAIFRFTPPPVQLATDYLLVIAGNEGHLLCREAVSTLFKSKCHDLRASIAELNFFCQMAIGDTKGGLEWMLIQPPGEKTQSEGCEDLRVVSEGTYFEGLGLLARNIPNSRLETSAVDEMELLSEAWSSWDTDPEKQEGFSEKEVVAPSSQQSRKTAFQSLLLIDQGLEALSAADTFPGFGFRDDSTVCRYSEKDNCITLKYLGYPRYNHSPIDESGSC